MQATIKVKRYAPPPRSMAAMKLNRENFFYLLNRRNDPWIARHVADGTYLKAIRSYRRGAIRLPS